MPKATVHVRNTKVEPASDADTRLKGAVFHVEGEKATPLGDLDISCAPHTKPADAEKLIEAEATRMAVAAGLGADHDVKIEKPENPIYEKPEAGRPDNELPGGPGSGAKPDNTLPGAGGPGGGARPDNELPGGGAQPKRR